MADLLPAYAQVVSFNGPSALGAFGSVALTMIFGICRIVVSIAWTAEMKGIIRASTPFVTSHRDSRRRHDLKEPPLHCPDYKTIG